jgi:hypothetical protein
MTGFAIAAIALATNLGHFGRNMALFGTPLGESHEEINEIFGVQALASNALRNLQIHMLPESPNYPGLYNDAVRAVTGFSAGLHALTRLKPDDPRTTFNGDYAGFEQPNGLNRDEGLAGNFAHFLLIAISLPVGLLTKDRKLKELALTFVIAFLLFSLLLKSHTHISRLQLPLFILWMPVASLALFRDKFRYAVWLSLFIWLMGIPWLLGNASRPLLATNANPIIKELAASNDL